MHGGRASSEEKIERLLTARHARPVMVSVWSYNCHRARLKILWTGHSSSSVDHQSWTLPKKSVSLCFFPVEKSTGNITLVLSWGPALYEKMRSPHPKKSLRYLLPEVAVTIVKPVPRTMEAVVTITCWLLIVAIAKVPNWIGHGSPLFFSFPLRIFGPRVTYQCNPSCIIVIKTPTLGVEGRNRETEIKITTIVRTIFKGQGMKAVVSLI